MLEYDGSLAHKFTRLPFDILVSKRVFAENVSCPATALIDCPPLETSTFTLNVFPIVYVPLDGLRLSVAASAEAWKKNSAAKNTPTKNLVRVRSTNDFFIHDIKNGKRGNDQYDDCSW